MKKAKPSVQQDLKQLTLTSFFAMSRACTPCGAFFPLPPAGAGPAESITRKGPCSPRGNVAAGPPPIYKQGRGCWTNAWTLNGVSWDVSPTFTHGYFKVGSSLVGAALPMGFGFLGPFTLSLRPSPHPPHAR